MNRQHTTHRTRRRAGRRVRWRAVGWLLATIGLTIWWATQPQVGWTQVPCAAAAYALLLGAALAAEGSHNREGEPVLPSKEVQP